MFEYRIYCIYIIYNRWVYVHTHFHNTLVQYFRRSLLLPDATPFTSLCHSLDRRAWQNVLLQVSRFVPTAEQVAALLACWYWYLCSWWLLISISFVWSYDSSSESLWDGNLLGCPRKLQYCWWLKSCTTWDVWNPKNNGIFTISTGAGFQPSTVVNG